MNLLSTFSNLSIYVTLIFTITVFIIENTLDNYLLIQAEILVVNLFFAILALEPKIWKSYSVVA